MSRKKTGYGKIFDIFGSILLVAVLAVMAWNFTRDARLFEKPVLSTAGSSANKSTASTGDGYKTITYKKPASASKAATGSKSGSKTGSTAGKTSGKTSGGAAASKTGTGSKPDSTTAASNSNPNP